MLRLPRGYFLVTFQVFQEFNCTCDDCKWFRLSEVHAVELDDSCGSSEVDEIIIESGEVFSENSPSYFLIELRKSYFLIELRKSYFLIELRKRSLSLEIVSPISIFYAIWDLLNSKCLFTISPKIPKLF